MIKAAGKEDLRALTELAAQLWEEHTVAELADALSDQLSNGGARFFIRYEKDAPVGFAQCQLRYDYVEGTGTSPVGYLEGIFVKETFRNRGFAGELLRACEAWAKENGCTEFASDCELENEDSLRFHLAAGFREANRVICFVKPL